MTLPPPDLYDPFRHDTLLGSIFIIAVLLAIYGAISLLFDFVSFLI